jgi:hypothetical protein
MTSPWGSPDDTGDHSLKTVLIGAILAVVISSVAFGFAMWLAS